MHYLTKENIELNKACNNFTEEVAYLKLREKKIMYLIHLLQGKGYPVTQIFEEQVKPINTMRFDEFLIEKEREQQIEDEENAKIQVSFYSSDSFELLVDGPIILPTKPKEIPNLNLNGLPEYETSSDEEEEETQQNHDYSLS